MLKPKANYTLTKYVTKIVCRWNKELRMLDGYSSNLARSASIEKGSIHGVKSHDFHVFIEILLLVVFISLPIHVLNLLIEISHFKDLCSTTLTEDSLRRFEENILFIQIGNNIPFWILLFNGVFPYSSSIWSIT